MKGKSTDQRPARYGKMGARGYNPLECKGSVSCNSEDCIFIATCQIWQRSDLWRQ
jgi:hypothetical protein